MALFGGGDEVKVTINGESRGLQDAVGAAERSMQSMHRTLRDGQDTVQNHAFTFDSLGKSVLGSLGPVGNFLITANSLFGVLGAITTPIKDVAEGFLRIGETVAHIAWDGLQTGIDLTKQLAEQVLDLSSTTEKNFFNWQYLFGGPQGGGLQAAQGLMGWSSKYSMQIPYTRQDLMSAITTLSSQNFTPEQIEQFMPVIADLASTQGRPGLTLQWAARSVVEAMLGQNRMLKMDLNIGPNALEDKFGFNPDDPQGTLLPALLAYEKSKGSAGAAKDISTQTWWGSFSSFIDRLQNAGLMVGGTDLSGNVAKGSFFDKLKTDLNAISDWMDKHWDDTIKPLTDLVGRFLSGGVGLGESFFGGLFKGITDSPMAAAIFQDVKEFVAWLNAPSTQAGAAYLGNLFAQVAAPTVKAAFDAAKDFFLGLQASGAGQTLLKDIQDFAAWISDPKTQQDIKNFGYWLGVYVGDNIILLSNDIRLLIDSVGGLVTVLIDAGAVMKDQISGDYAQMAIDLAKMGADWDNLSNKVTTDAAQAALSAAKLLHDMTNPPPSVGGGGGGLHAAPNAPQGGTGRNPGVPQYSSSVLGGAVQNNYGNYGVVNLTINSTAPADQVAAAVGEMLGVHAQQAALGTRAPGGFRVVGALGMGL